MSLGLSGSPGRAMDWEYTNSKIYMYGSLPLDPNTGIDELAADPNYLHIKRTQEFLEYPAEVPTEDSVSLMPGTFPTTPRPDRSPATTRVRAPKRAKPAQNCFYRVLQRVIFGLRLKPLFERIAGSNPLAPSLPRQIGHPYNPRHAPVADTQTTYTPFPQYRDSDSPSQILEPLRNSRKRAGGVAMYTRLHGNEQKSAKEEESVKRRGDKLVSTIRSVDVNRGLELKDDDPIHTEIKLYKGPVRKYELNEVSSYEASKPKNTTDQESSTTATTTRGALNSRKLSDLNIQYKPRKSVHFEPRGNGEPRVIIRGGQEDQEDSGASTREAEKDEINLAAQLGVLNIFRDDEGILTESTFVKERRAEKQRKLEQERKIQEEKKRVERERAEALERERRLRDLLETGGRRTSPHIIQALPTHWESKVVRLRDHYPNDEIVKAPGGNYLTHKDFSTLDGKSWLNDEIINAYIDYVVASANAKYAAIAEETGKPSKVPHVVAMNSFYYPKLTSSEGAKGASRWFRRKKIQGKDLINVHCLFIPICRDLHWTLGVVSPKSRTIEYLDSFGGRLSGFVEAMKDMLQYELGDLYKEEEWKVLKTRSTVQRNGYDCGVFLLTNCQCVAEGTRTDGYSADHLSMQRRYIAGVLLNGGFHGDLARKVDSVGV